jgi:hypothetical protein
MNDGWWVYLTDPASFVGSKIKKCAIRQLLVGYESTSIEVRQLRRIYLDKVI